MFLELRRLRKPLCSLLAFLVAYTPIAIPLSRAHAEEVSIESVGKEANAFGRSLGGSATGSVTFDGASLHLKNPQGGQDYSISKNDLAPTPNGKNLRYAHTQEDFEKQKEIYNDAGEMSERGGKQKDKLFADAASENPTLEGEVYAILTDMASKNKGKLSEEVFLKRTADIMADMDNVLKDLVSCDADSALDKETRTEHIPDYKLCQQVVDHSSTCVVEHAYVAGVIEYASGPFNIKSCGEGCTQIWLGEVGNNYIDGGSCSLHTEEILFKVWNPEAIAKAELDYAAYDDQMQIWIGPKGQETKIYQGPRDTFPYEDYSNNRVPGVACELRTHWIWDPYRNGYGCTESACAYTQQNLPAIDITQYLRQAGNGGLVRFYLRDAIGGQGEAYARIRIQYDPNKVISNDIWKPKACIDSAAGLADGFAKGSVKCTDMPDVGVDGCTFVNGGKICKRALAPSPLKGISRFCRRAEVKSNYSFYKGNTGCWKVLAGFDNKGNPKYEEVCGGENLGGNLDSCKQYAENPKCKFVKSECTEGMTGDSGTCYVNDVTYDCGEDVVIDNIKADTKYDCKGIKCLGEDCIDVNRTYNTDFGRVNALLNAAQYMAQDMQCEGLDADGNPIGDRNINCIVFGGTAGKCKIAVGGWQDCCESVGGPGLGAYIAMILQAQSLHAETMALSQIGGSFANTIAGQAAGQYAKAFGEVTTILKSGIDSVLNAAFNTTLDGIYSHIDFLFAPFKWFKEMVIEKIEAYLREMMTKILTKLGFEGAGEAAAGEGASQTPMFQSALNQVFGAEAGAMVGSAITFVGWVYLAYQVARLVVAMVFKCEQAEYEMTSKRDTKNCHYVGSYCSKKVLKMCVVKKRAYCCFESPLSRIVNEQVKLRQPELLGADGDWGTPENPKCGGIPVSVVDQIDWDKIDLSEWEAILISTGNQIQGPQVNMDRLTGAASQINWTGSKGTATQWGIPPSATSNTTVTRTPQNAPRRARRSVSNTDRPNVLERSEQKLNGMHVDELRIEGARCISLELGNGVLVRGDCGEKAETTLFCRHNGALIDCEEVAYMNHLNDLLNTPMTSAKYWNDGYRCTFNKDMIDCSTLTSDEAYVRALEEYARQIGGTTYLNRYVCLDKSGTHGQAICEEAMRQNGCSCLPGHFVCQDGNKEISCRQLGTVESECPCFDGVCEKECEYGGIPKGQERNSRFTCSQSVCPYGSTDKAKACSKDACPYGSR